MVSVFVPILYLAVLIGGLGTFSYFYRRRQSAPVSQLEAWFPANTARDIYFSLQAQDDVPSGILKSALLLRAVEDIKRLQKIQTQKNALNVLMQKGGAGDDLWTRFLQLEEEMKAEVMDVMSEAGALQEGWQQIIFQTANEMWLNDQSRQTVSKIVSMAATAKTEGTARREHQLALEARIAKNSQVRVLREREQERERAEAEERRAEEQRQKAVQDLIAMEEKEKEHGKSKSASSSPRMRRKK